MKVQPEPKPHTRASDFLDWSRRGADRGADPLGTHRNSAAVDPAGVGLDTMPWEALATTTLYGVWPRI